MRQKDKHTKKFIRYNSIERYENLEKIWDKYAIGLSKRSVFEWQITEKLHGTNICVSNRYKEGVAFFTRNGNQLPPVLQKMMESYDWKGFFVRNPEIDFVYGEGAGPGIQKGINYGEEKRFYLIDAKNKNEIYQDEVYRLPPDLVLKDFFGFYYVPVVSHYSGTFEDVIKTLIRMLKVDPVSWINPIEGNIIEGYVVKCLDRPMLTSETRFIFKIKHPKFDEKRNAPKRANRRKFEDIDYSPVEPYVNENRIQSAISKFPEYKKHQIGDVMREIVRDVQADMKKDNLRWDRKYCKYINQFASKIVVREVSV